MLWSENSGAWDLAAARLRAADELRRAWLDAHTDCRPTPEVARTKPPPTRLRSGIPRDTVRTCAIPGCAATWLHIEAPLRKFCLPCGRERKAAQERVLRVRRIAARKARRP